MLLFIHIIVCFVSDISADSADDYDDEYSTDYIEPAGSEIRFSFFDSDWIYEFFTHDGTSLCSL